MRTRSIRDVAGPAALIALLGLWAFFVPLVGPYFGFGFHTDETWSFSEQHWVLSLAPGLAAALAGLLMMVPAPVAQWTVGLLALLAGAWLVLGPSLYPLWSSGDLEPVSGSETTRALLWVGYYYGVGALILYLTGLAQGLVARLARNEPELVEEPLEPELEPTEPDRLDRRPLGVP